MQSMPRSTKIVHYALLDDIEGTATHTAGGYYFRPTSGDTRPRLVAYNTPALVLCGRVDLADAQRQTDGDLAAKICGY